MLILLALMIEAQVDPPVPTGVNGSVLGEAQDYAVVGPTIICTPALRFAVDEGERVYLAYSGIHNLRLTLTGKLGSLELSEGDAWAKPRKRGQLLFQKSGMRIYEIGSEPKLSYLVYGADAYSKGRFYPRVWISGEMLRGNHKDRKLLKRFEFRENAPSDCSVSYGYGWGVLLEGDPLFERNE
jgi:hypothetical protein